MSIELRTIHDSEVEAFLDAVLTTFGDDPEQDPDAPARIRALIDLSQAWAAFDVGRIVATAATINQPIGVPGGGNLPMAGLTMACVRPTHRRRGLLRALMQLHLEDARHRGLPASGLWASEAPIYGRFGYGVAAEHDTIEIEQTRTLTFLPERELDAVEWIDESRARELLPDVYARATAQRPGALRRSEAWWRERRFLEIPRYRSGGASRRRHVVARRGPDVAGYLVYRQRLSWGEAGPSGKLQIVELLAVDARAATSLWQFALAVDLFPTVSWEIAPVDDVLLWTVSDRRRVTRHRSDNLWLRVGDIAATLAAREYGLDGVLRFALEDTSWELVVDGGRGECSATTRTPDLRLDRATLSSLYLGGFSASTLARAGFIYGEPRALAMADQMFASAVAPWCPEVF